MNTFKCLKVHLIALSSETALTRGVIIGISVTIISMQSFHATFHHLQCPAPSSFENIIAG